MNGSSNRQMSQNDVIYLNTQSFIRQGSGVVCWGHAPDGLPLLTTIKAPISAKVLLQQAARALGVESDSFALAGTPLEPMAKDLDRLLKAHLIQALSSDNNDLVEVMLLSKLVPTLCGTTLFARILTSRLAAITHSAMSADTRVVPLEHTLMTSTAHLPLPKLNLGQRCLALSLERFQPFVVKKEASRNGWPQYSLLRKFVEESVTQIPGGSYECEFYDQTAWRTEQVDAMDTTHYQRRRLQVPDAVWTWCVPRNSVAQLVVDLARCLETLHQQGEIHGDVKPANTLITAQGMVLIDSLGLTGGLRSPALTRGWAAPEQVMGLPVRYQTDQYPLGLMLLELLQGVLYGEESRVLIPAGGTQVETHTILKSPGVYIDPNTAPVETQAVPLWSQAIARCLRFDPTERFPSMASLADALQPLIQGQSLQGHIRVPLSFGTCVRGSNEAGEVTPCWLMD